MDTFGNRSIPPNEEKLDRYANRSKKPTIGKIYVSNLGECTPTNPMHEVA
jgi:hypothetical protein